MNKRTIWSLTMLVGLLIGIAISVFAFDTNPHLAGYGALMITTYFVMLKIGGVFDD